MAGSKVSATLITIADDLAAFRNFLVDENINYRSFPRLKFARPTYRYHGHLLIAVRSGAIAASTARRRLQTMIAFYRWLVAEEKFEPEHAMWRDRDLLVPFGGPKGSGIRRISGPADIGISRSTQSDPYSGEIQDGGRLRPLSIQEQKALIDTLIELRNTEMMLIHLIALFTGARTQTILTLKVSHFLGELPSSVSAEIPLPCGPGTEIDTKYDKPLVLFFPRWLYEMLRDYSFSDRAQTRRRRSTVGDEIENYLFLSRQGNPLYADKSSDQFFDANKLSRYTPNGAALRVFVRDRVLPRMRKLCGPKFHYKFHDLRATFGMNLTDTHVALVQRGEVTLHEAREFVRTRMGHESSATTDLYLQYRNRVKLVSKVQERYEAHLSGLIDSAKRGFGEVENNSD
jgi:integrase